MRTWGEEGAGGGGMGDGEVGREDGEGSKD